MQQEDTQPVIRPGTLGARAGKRGCAAWGRGLGGGGSSHTKNGEGVQVVLDL